MASDKLTDEQKTVIALYTDSYRDSTAKEKKKVLKNLLQALFPKGINPTPDEKDTRVRNIKAIKPALMAYLGNHARRQKSKIRVSYVRSWSLSQVVGHEKKAELEQLCREKSGHLPGSKPYFGVYQTVLSDVVKALSAQDRERYENMAKEWTERRPPAELQQKMAEKHAHAYLKQFAEQMWMQLGMRVFILTAHKDSLGTIDIADHDFNDELGGRSFGQVRPNWMEKPILGEWSRYVEAELDPENAQSSDEEVKSQRKKKVPIILDTADTGSPLLPATVADGSMTFDKLHPILREYLNCHYRLASGYPKASVPWNDLTRNQADYIEDQYLPVGFELQKEPSKMNKHEVETLLGFWLKREQNGRVPVAFQFKGYKDRSTGDVVPAIQNTGTVGRSKGRKVGSRKNIQRLQKSPNTDPQDLSETESILPEIADGNLSKAPAGSGNRSGKLDGKRKAASDMDDEADDESDDGTLAKKRRLVKAREIGEEQTSPQNAEGNCPTGRTQRVEKSDVRTGDLENEVSDGVQKGGEPDAGTNRRRRKGPPGIRMSEQGSKTVQTRSESSQAYIPVQTRAAAQRAAKQK